ncbi:hypothetical protein HPB51_003030 [Rhipicephalus microplus]|uniref:Complex 1 LYR protein domain-containing protein n=1 Tax=Rhipicephalus microplus TaxID=6941 RepID=A0A9J6DTB7_RHIMP|nr:hypothetical protein HPB51_003030 [Rhipicephalus microplus]
MDATKSTLSSESSTEPHVNDTAAGSSTGTTELLDNEVQKNNAVYYRRQVSPNRLHAERLLHLGRDYPKGYDYFRSRLKAAFLKNRDVKDPEQLTMLLARGQYIIKELEALYMLKKYRTLKKRYYTDTP